jgi:hypothetical protein
LYFTTPPSRVVCDRFIRQSQYATGSPEMQYVGARPPSRLSGFRTPAGRKAHILLPVSAGRTTLFFNFQGSDIRPDMRFDMAGKKQQAEEMITINGFVEEIEWEDGDRGLVIYDGENDYSIKMDQTGKMLFDHIDDEVEITGTVSMQDGDWVLSVDHFLVVDYYDDRDDEDYVEYWDE